MNIQCWQLETARTHFTRNLSYYNKVIWCNLEQSNAWMEPRGLCGTLFRWPTRFGWVKNRFIDANRADNWDFFLSFRKTNILAVKLKEINWTRGDKRIPLEDLWTLSDAKLRLWHHQSSPLLLLSGVFTWKRVNTTDKSEHSEQPLQRPSWTLASGP